MFIICSYYVKVEKTSIEKFLSKVSNIDTFTKEMFIIFNSQNSYILMHLMFNTFDESENMQGESLYVTEG